MNNGKYHTDDYRQKQEAKNIRIYGPEMLHRKVCTLCWSDYEWFGRLKTKAYLNSQFCSRLCANTRNGERRWMMESPTNYRTICYRHHDRKCLICGFSYVVETHHVNGDHQDNRPINLVPLCPNHHQMAHTKKWAAEINNRVLEYQKLLTLPEITPK